MEWIRGGPLPAASFQIDQARFTLPADVMNKPDVVASGIGMIMRKEGFKEIPPVVPRTPDGCFILNRPPEAFELLVEHLLGLDPLTRVPLHLFADKYISLKSELAFWQLPTEDVPFHDRIYFETAWTDTHCVFPLAEVDAAAFRRESVAEPTSSRRVPLQSVDERPAELTDELLRAADKRMDEGTDSPSRKDERWQFFVFDAAGKDGAVQGTTAAPPSPTGRIVFAIGQTRFLCRIPFLAIPCVHYGKLPDRGDSWFSPFLIIASPMECTMVWTAGCFIHIKVKETHAAVSAAAAARAAFSSSTPAKSTFYAEINVIEQTPSWLCFHPHLDFVLSGVKGPVPNVYTFDMPGASAVRFYPWGAVVINGKVELQPKKRLDATAVIKSQISSSGVLAERRRSTEENVKRMLTFLPGQQQQMAKGLGEAVESSFAPAKAVVVACILRSKQKVVKPIEKVFVINVDHENEGTLTLKHGEDYDLLDTRNEEGVDFNIVVSVRGGLTSRQRDDFHDTKRGETAAVVAVDASGHLTPHTHLLINNGVPPGEMLRSLTLTGEYSILDRQYYNFEVGTKLFEFHRSLYMLRSAQSSGPCTIM